MSIYPPQICGEPPSRKRHARESTARAAALTGVSREAVRQAKAIMVRSPDLAEKVKAGTMTLNRAYLLALGDTRKPLYIKLPVALEDKLRAAADYLDISRQTVVRMALAQFLSDDEEEG